MSQGSLSTPTVAFDSGQRNPALKLKPLTQSVLPSAYTIAQLSQQLINTYSYQNGDYLTFVAIRSQAQPAQTLEDAIEYKALTSRVINAEWEIKQMQIDTNSNALVSSLGIFIFPGTVADTMETLQYLDNSNAYAAQYVFGTTIVVSRVMPDNKVKTSTSQIITNAATHTACEIGKSLAWRTWVGENWEEQEQELLRANDILKGSISENDVNFNMPIDVRVNGRVITPGAIINEYGPLVINSLGNYPISQIKLFNDNTEWQPVSTSGNTATYNMQSNGMYIIKVGSDIIYSFRNDNEQDFTIDATYEYNQTNPNEPGPVARAGTYIQWKSALTSDTPSRWVKSTGAAIANLELTATNGATVTASAKDSQYGDDYVRFSIKLNNASGAVSVFLGNVLVMYIENVTQPTQTVAKARAKEK